MGIVQRKLSRSFKAFFDSEKSSGILLIVCTAVSLIFANSILGKNYLSIWSNYIGPLSVEHWINDGLMAIFFLLIGLELKRELYNGELSNFKNALLPIFAALGGLAFPALIHFFLNAGTPTQAGIGIPMATDIAFALGALAILGNRVPASLKVFVVAFAVLDDLCAIVIIAVFYTAELSALYLVGALLVLATLAAAARFLGIKSLVVYLLVGALAWYLMLKSGVHATIAGVLLAFAIPSSELEDDEESPSYQLEHLLHMPVAFVILPIFALCNTGIVIGADWAQNLTTPNSFGIIGGLVLGKPLGITLLSFIAVSIGICKLPLDLNWRHVLGAGLLGGIGFTMSIFITNLAFTDNALVINNSKMAILLASFTAGTAGFIWLKLFGQPEESDEDIDAMDFHVTET
ncbi:MAG: Na+/H+ antiporter NhaA [Acidobacteria bacterium]|nr:Na+/H+ antiporter NhaA [Acidobacteriota bacterium]